MNNKSGYLNYFLRSKFRFGTDRRKATLIEYVENQLEMKLTQIGSDSTCIVGKCEDKEIWINLHPIHDAYNNKILCYRAYMRIETIEQPQNIDFAPIEYPDPPNIGNIEDLIIDWSA